ncbi:acetylglutamate/acetylaminoadipate kinase [Halodesulfurarchaeum sp.]|uniref:acetylglutamate/acetylaminoadipate kinase n=1 Tax=Halodesulfurarchaeum sp. TaxID=1980530 RepID=UPI001BBA7D4D|nr:acetylglutamate/acetylaminoadipate kinase [Halodesulfurarchaeum sp.]
MTVVVKIGGAQAVDPAGALTDVATLVDDGESLVVVHGGSTAVDETLERMDIEPEYVETPDGVVGRFTDAETMEVFKMVFGKLNLDLVTKLQDVGVDAVGLSGPDGHVLEGSRKSAIRVLEDGKRKIRRGDHSGTIESVNDELLSLLFDGGYTPVVSVPMLAKEGTAVNSDADRAAAAVAGALEATLVELTDVSGVYADPDDPQTRIETVETPTDFETLEAAAEGFMGRKVMAAREALESGAERVVIGDANADDPISRALAGDGTVVEPAAVSDQ